MKKYKSFCFALISTAFIVNCYNSTFADNTLVDKQKDIQEVLENEEKYTNSETIKHTSSPSIENTKKMATEYFSDIKNQDVDYADFFFNHASNSNITLPFSDIDNKEWYLTSVKYNFANNFMTGKDTTSTFKPNDNITRAEVAALLGRSSIYLVEKPVNPFSDLTKSHWAYNDIMYFANAKLIFGYEDGTFKPDKTITRAELAVIFERFIKNDLGNDTKVESKSVNFSDLKSSHWAYNSIVFINNSLGLAGYEDGTFRPDQPITRAEVAALRMKMDNYMYSAIFDVYIDAASSGN